MHARSPANCHSQHVSIAPQTEPVHRDTAYAEGHEELSSAQELLHPSNPVTCQELNHPSLFCVSRSQPTCSAWPVIRGPRADPSTLVDSDLQGIVPLIGSRVGCDPKPGRAVSGFTTGSTSPRRYRGCPQPSAVAPS